MVQSGEDFLRLREVVYQNIREMAEELTKGKIAPLPARGGRVKDPCSYCGFGPLCNNAGGAVFRVPRVLPGHLPQTAGDALLHLPGGGIGEGDSPPPAATGGWSGTS